MCLNRPLRLKRKLRSKYYVGAAIVPPTRFLPLWGQKGKLGVFSPSALRAPPSSEGGKYTGSFLKPGTLPFGEGAPKGRETDPTTRCARSG